VTFFQGKKFLEELKIPSAQISFPKEEKDRLYCIYWKTRYSV